MDPSVQSKLCSVAHGKVDFLQSVIAVQTSLILHEFLG